MFSNKRVVILSFLGAIIYFAVWSYLASPYRFFPSDDKGVYFSFLQEKSIWEAFYTHQPVTLIFLKVSAKVCSIFSSDKLSGFIFFCIISNSITLFLLNLMVYKITGSITAAFMSMLLYGTSAWPANYYFLFSYAPFASMLSLSGVYFLYNSYINEKRKIFYIISSGVLCGLLFWSSPSAPLMILLIISALFYLFPVRLKGNQKILRSYLATIFSVIIIFFISGSGPYMLVHLFENLKGHYLDAYNKFGYIPKSPFISFLWIAGTYNLPLIILFMACTIFVLSFLKNKKWVNDIEAFKNKKFLLILGAIIWIHIIAIDILPFTKTARNHFQIYPLLCIVTPSFLYFMGSEFFYNYKKKFLIFICILTALILFINVQSCAKIIYSRTSIPKNLALIDQKVQLYILNEDPHSAYLLTWLSEFNIERVTAGNFLDKVLLRGNKKMGLIVGPTGFNSGISALRHCCLEDFFIEQATMDQLLKNSKVVKLPYYSNFTPFLLEEEICQAMYFSGKVPSTSSITLFLWGH